MNYEKYLKRTEFLFLMIMGFIGEILGAILVLPGPIFYVLFALTVAGTFFLAFAKKKIYKYNGYFASTTSIILLALLCYYGNRFQTANIVFLTYICFCALFRDVGVSICSAVLITVVEIIIYVFFGLNLNDSGFSYFVGSVLPLYFAQFYLIVLIKIIDRRELTYKHQNESNEELLKVVNMKKAETEEANRIKTEFLANMSHEIRTPINSILGFNELILREARDKDINNIIRYAENALQSGKTLLTTINDILDFSKIESGKAELLPEKYELCSLIDETVIMNCQRAEEKGVTFICEISDDIPHILYGDKKRIKQIILNLLSNAVKYTQSGSITFSVHGTPHKYDEKNSSVETNPLNLPLNDSDKTVIDLHISVKDTGIGIKLEDLSKIFDEFERFDKKKNKSIEGTGLGLVITKFWTEAMGGSINVKSKYEIGSTFSVIIPQIVLADETVGAYKEQYIEKNEQTNTYKEKFQAPDAKILVVDDNEMNLLVFSELLKKTKMQIDTASSGKECLQLIRKTKYDLIFMDDMMPFLNGVETLRKMRSLPNNLCINAPVIALTANAISGMRNYYLNEGFTDYVPKPVNPEYLEDVLIKHLPKELILNLADSGSASAQKTDELLKAVISSEKSDISTLSDIDVDYKKGLFYAGNDTDNYIFNLTNFMNTVGKSLTRLEEFKLNHDNESYATAVHALKGNLRTIGADKLAELAFEHEKYAKNYTDTDYIDATFDQLINSVNNLCEVIKKII